MRKYWHRGLIGLLVLVVPALALAADSHLVYRKVDDQTDVKIRVGDVGGGLFAFGQASHLYDGTAWDRERGNVELTLLASAQRNTDTTTADQLNPNGRGAVVVLDLTAIGGTTPSLTFKVQGKDPASGKYYDLLASTVITSVSTTVLEVYPGIAEAVNATKSRVVPRTWRVSIDVDTADTNETYTYSLGAVVLR